MTRDYSAVEAKVEADMVRTELEPTPGDWHLTGFNGLGTHQPTEGKCCLLSPQLIGLPASGGVVDKLVQLLDVPTDWVCAVVDGFDSELPSSSTEPGYQFGTEMRRKYVKGAQV